MYVNDYSEAFKLMGYKETVKPNWYVYVKHDDNKYKVAIMLYNNFGSLLQTEKNLNSIKEQIDNDPKILPLEYKREYLFIVLVSKKAFFMNLGKSNNILQIAENGKYRESLNTTIFNDDIRELDRSRIYEQTVNNSLSYPAFYGSRISFITFLIALICVILMIKRIDPLEYGASYELVRVKGHYQNLLTANFLHVGIFHLLGNIVTLLIIGTSLEKKIGHLRYLVIILSSAFFTSILSISWYFIEERPQMITAGLSGVVFAILGADIVHGLKYKENTIYPIVLAIFNIFSGVFSPNINNIAHISGLFFGIWLMLVIIAAFGVKKDNLSSYIYKHRIRRLLKRHS